MNVNGITTSLINLLDNIDYDKYDVSVMIKPGENASENALIAKMNNNARVFCRNSTYNMTFGEQVGHMYLSRNGLRRVNYLIYKRECQRSYGNVEFDIAIDFDGYNSFFSILLLHSNSSKKAIWQHNDMLAEKELKFGWLTNIFGLYQYYDRIVSCSPDIMVVNRENLGDKYSKKSIYRFGRNMIDVDRVRRGEEEDALRTYDGKDYILLKEKITNGSLEVKLVSNFTEKDEMGNGYCRFVTMGRMSPEKNQLCLIRAFHRLYQENPYVVLYLIGDGKLKGKIIELIKELGLIERVILTGNIDNPFAIMKHCDCFILPSLHEGQPMVINEARVLNMPLIVGNFSSVKSMLLENGQILVDISEQSIYEGMKAFIDGSIPCEYDFDPIQYNNDVYAELEAVLMEML